MIRFTSNCLCVEMDVMIETNCSKQRTSSAAPHSHKLNLLTNGYLPLRSPFLPFPPILQLFATWTDWLKLRRPAAKLLETFLGVLQTSAITFAMRVRDNDMPCDRLRKLFACTHKKRGRATHNFLRTYIFSIATLWDGGFRLYCFLHGSKRYVCM